MPFDTADWYDRAATRDLVGHSALHVEWAAGVAADDDVVGLLDRLPRERRQPSLIFSVATWLGAEATDYPAFRAWLVEHWPAVEAVARERRTQTNEVGRCAPLVVALARIPGPLALLEVGAAAGLCAIPERYAYRFGERPVLGAGEPLIDCVVEGADLVPDSLPDIRWQLGLDLHPLSVADAADTGWLEALVPLDRSDRRARLRAALATARDDPPRVIAGDALHDLADAAAQAPADLTLVVVSLGTLVYLPPEARAAFPVAVAEAGARLVTLEQSGIADRPQGRVSAGRFVLALDGEAIAEASPHGDRLTALSVRRSAARHPGLPDAHP
ncbi:MAG: DUF2332 family protein [Pseudolysinimonas sp.]|uniref:DUF2332 family protein n=1 Tax=Pseudolysinimonas sp. TaxID=2680009 RepID=UPI003C76675E